MATLSASSAGGVDQPVTITGTGFATATNYTITVTHADGSTDDDIFALTDGSGNFTATYVAAGSGTDQIAVKPTSTANTATTTVVITDEQ